MNAAKEHWRKMGITLNEGIIVGISSDIA